MLLAQLPSAYLPGQARSLFPDCQPATPWTAYEAVQLAPGQALPAGAAAPAESLLMVLNGALVMADPTTTQTLGARQVVRLGATTQVQAGAAGACLVRATAGPGPTPRNTGARPTPGPTQVEALTPARLTWRAAIHGGHGRIASRHLWSAASFGTAWTFVDHAVLAADSSVGCHYHDGLEESFLVLAGYGTLVGGFQPQTLQPGTVTWQAIREPHGVHNPGPSPLEFLRLAVCHAQEAYTTVDVPGPLRPLAAGNPTAATEAR
jgi:mannose-6-phosphate isomerase-like protein (cupin superfamily)